MLGKGVEQVCGETEVKKRDHPHPHHPDATRPCGRHRAPAAGSHICIQSRRRERTEGGGAGCTPGAGGDDMLGTDSPSRPLRPPSPYPGFLVSCPAPMSPLGFLMDADSKGCLPAPRSTTPPPPPSDPRPARPLSFSAVQL